MSPQSNDQNSQKALRPNKFGPEADRERERDRERKRERERETETARDRVRGRTHKLQAN